MGKLLSFPIIDFKQALFQVLSTVHQIMSVEYFLSVVPIEMKTKHPVYIMFGVVINNGNIMPPFIFPHGLRPDIEAYIKCLECYSGLRE